MARYLMPKMLDFPLYSTDRSKFLNAIQGNSSRGIDNKMISRLKRELVRLGNTHLIKRFFFRLKKRKFVNENVASYTWTTD